VACPNWTSSGIFGGAFEFDGSGDYIDCGNDTSLDFEIDNFSVSVWVKTDLNDDFDIIYKMVGGNPGWGLYTNASGMPGFWAQGSAGAAVTLNALTAIGDGEWHHIAVTRGGNDFEIFLDGNSEDSDTVAVQNLNTSHNLEIGKDNGVAGWEWNGTIDEVAIYNRSLTATEISDLYERDVWHTDTAWFTLDFICTGSYIDANTSYKCMGSSMNYLAPCRRFGFDTFQWDTTNMTLCQYGCRNGVCLNVTYKTCHNRCNVNETVCTSDNRYSVPCKNHTQTGCFDWDYENKTYCDIGCHNGQCMTKIHFCTAGESKCGDGYVVFCDDDNSDGYYEWSEYNRTTCEYRCQQDYNLTSQRWNASCHYHSYTTPELIFSRFEWISNMGTAMFVNPFLQMAIVLIVAIIIAIISSLIGSWRMGIPAFFGIMLLGTIGGWMPWYITFIMIILGGLVVFKGGLS